MSEFRPPSAIAQIDAFRFRRDQTRVPGTEKDQRLVMIDPAVFSEYAPQVVHPEHSPLSGVPAWVFRPLSDEPNLRAVDVPSQRLAPIDLATLQGYSYGRTHYGDVPDTTAFWHAALELRPDQVCRVDSLGELVNGLRKQITTQVWQYDTRTTDGVMPNTLEFLEHQIVRLNITQESDREAYFIEGPVPIIMNAFVGSPVLRTVSDITLQDREQIVLFGSVLRTTISAKTHESQERMNAMFEYLREKRETYQVGTHYVGYSIRLSSSPVTSEAQTLASVRSKIAYLGDHRR